MTREVHLLSSQLTDRLVSTGELASDGPLTEAFRQVDRGVFVPAFGLFEHTKQGTRYRLVRRDDPEQYGEWATHVYADETLIIEIKGFPAVEALSDGTGTGRWTSSSTKPGLMAQMLNELDLADGLRVLEIGLGSGYNAAILTEVLGEDSVTSIDISPRLVSDAIMRLSALDYHPVVAACDGHQGYPERAPYDRIISTTAFTHVPTEWVKQVRSGGQILVNIAGGTGGAMLNLQVRDDGTAQGRFIPQWAGFMPARSASPRERANVDDEGENSETTLNPSIVRDDPAMAFLAQLATTDGETVLKTADDGTDFLFLEGADGAWAEIDMAPVNSRHKVVQGGPRRLWTCVEAAHQWWLAEGKPDWSAFGMTVTQTSQHVWYGSPDSHDRWGLANLAPPTEKKK